MVVAYARVSTDRQDERSQREIVNEYAAGEGIKIDKWVLETITSRSARSERKLAGVLEALQVGDTLIVSEPSRLARGGMIELAGVVDQVKQKKARLIVVNGVGGKPLTFETGMNADIMSEMALAFVGWGANMERTNIGERTRAALAARKAAGIKLGRPTGTKLTDEQAAAVRKYLAMGIPKTVTAKLAGITRGKLLRWIKSNQGGKK